MKTSVNNWDKLKKYFKYDVRKKSCAEVMYFLMNTNLVSNSEFTPFDILNYHLDLYRRSPHDYECHITLRNREYVKFVLRMAKYIKLPKLKSEVKRNRFDTKKFYYE